MQGIVCRSAALTIQHASPNWIKTNACQTSSMCQTHRWNAILNNSSKIIPRAREVLIKAMPGNAFHVVLISDLPSDRRRSPCWGAPSKTGGGLMQGRQLYRRVGLSRRGVREKRRKYLDLDGGVRRMRCQKLKPRETKGGGRSETA